MSFYIVSWVLGSSFPFFLRLPNLFIIFGLIQNNLVYFHKQVKLWFYKLAAAGLAAILKAGQYFPKVLTQSCSGMVKKEKCQNKPKTATLYELHKKATILKNSKFANKTS